jgi:hypothetical protein
MDKNVLKRRFATCFGGIVVFVAGFAGPSSLPSLADETLKVELWDKQDGS